MAEGHAPREASMSDRSDEVHKRVRHYRSSAFADLMDQVYLTMNDAEKDRLPSETGSYVNEIVAHALNHVQQFADELKRTVAGTYAENRGGERFLLDPIR